MIDLKNITLNSTPKEVIEELTQLFTPYAQELLKSGGDFSYMNMYADNFKEQIAQLTGFDEFEVFEILNEACDMAWRGCME